MPRRTHRTTHSRVCHMARHPISWIGRVTIIGGVAFICLTTLVVLRVSHRGAVMSGNKGFNDLVSASANEDTMYVSYDIPSLRLSPEDLSASKALVNDRKDWTVYLVLMYLRQHAAALYDEITPEVKAQ